MDCDYCTGRAVGRDAGGAPTCGAASCEPVARALPPVEEASGEADDECPTCDGSGEDDYGDRCEDCDGTGSRDDSNGRP